MKTIETERTRMLKQYDAITQPLCDFFGARRPWGVNFPEPVNWIGKIRLELETAPFVGMVVRTPPPPHREFDLYVNVRNPNEPKQNPKFCRWFENIRRIEIREAKQGENGYRLTQIKPICKVERVTFRTGFGWLTVEEWLRARTLRAKRKK